MRVWPLHIAVIALALAGMDLPAQEQRVSSGRIEGRVTLSPELTTRRRAARPYATRGPSAGTPAAADTNELQNVVVYIEGVQPGSGNRTAAAVTMTQSGESFTPHVLPIVAGTTVDFPNGDPIFHNVFSLSRTRTFDLGRYPQSASKRVRFDRPGVVQVFCHIHADMSAVILVLENSWFTMADAGGNFSLENLPPGEYRVVAWHERIRPVVRTVKVTAGTVSRVDYMIPLPQLAGE